MIRYCRATLLCLCANVYAAPGEPDESGIGGTGRQPPSMPVPESFARPALPPAAEFPMLTPPTIPRIPEPPMVNVPTPPETTTVTPKP
ncbi:MAG: hypothetical protein AABY83_02650 [Pseudomonadota bacterium]